MDPNQMNSQDQMNQQHQMNNQHQMNQQHQMSRPQSTLSKITNFFSGPSSNTKTLLKWKQSSEQEEWANKAVDTLVRKLKKQTNGIKNITEVLKSRSENSICVTIPRSIDGRLQVCIVAHKCLDLTNVD